MASNFEYDAFISYAVEDKDGIVNELVQKLEESGIRVWYTSSKLGAGKCVYETIKEGLNKSKHGIVVLSPNYFIKEWPRREYHVLWAKENGRDRKILPVWYNVTEKEIKAFDPYLANNYGLDSARGLDLVVSALAKQIGGSEYIERAVKKKALFSIHLDVGILGIKAELDIEVKRGNRNSDSR